MTDVTRDLLLGFGRCPFGFCPPENVFNLQFVTLLITVLCHISKQCEMWDYMKQIYNDNRTHVTDVTFCWDLADVHLDFVRHIYKICHPVMSHLQAMHEMWDDMK